MPDFEPTPITIVNQGKPVVNHAAIYRRGDGVVAAFVDLGSKRCQPAGTEWTDGEAPVIGIEHVEGTSLHPHKTAEGDTSIRFDDFAGWTVWSSSISRYELFVCLVKQEDAPHA